MLAPDAALNFARPVPADGYAWWYLDALSDDGEHGLVIIAFIGSVFSPYYAYARRRGPTNPEHYCAINVALKSRRQQRWAMTERGAARLARSDEVLVIGPSALHATADSLRIDIDEVCAPLPFRLRGRVEVQGIGPGLGPYALDGDAAHLWQPIAPTARVTVDFTQPGARWSGHGYLDTNRGQLPLERSFRGWHWSRMRLPDGSGRLLYDVDALDGRGALLALDIDRDGVARHGDAPPPRVLAKSRWGIERVTRAAPDTQVDVLDTLEDAPFYARSTLRTTVAGVPSEAVHESLSLRRFVAPWVQFMLPFRMPRSPW